jgi:hypothetical protein
MTETNLDQLNRLLTGTTNLGKREIVRRAIEIVERQDKQIHNQVGAINRLLERWNLLHIFLTGMAEVFKDAKNNHGLMIVVGIQEEMKRMEAGES